MNARALLSLLFHADKALDLVRTARALGLIARLDAGPVALGDLADAIGARPLRLYKFLDALESLGLVTRDEAADDLLAVRYVSSAPLAEAVEAVLGEQSIERDRDTYPWRELHGRLAELLAGTLDTPFAWPPRTASDVRAFEASMTAGCPPIVEALRASRETLFGGPATAEASARTAARRWLDVGGGDGTVAEALLREPCAAHLRCDVFNLPAVAPLVQARAQVAGLDTRLGFVAGDFLRDPLPAGYDLLSFIRVLHDWPADTARLLLRKSREALTPGGRIVICEEFRTPDRLAVQFFWTYFLIGADSCVSRLREVSWYADALADLGFVDIRVRSGPFDLITATA